MAANQPLSYSAALSGNKSPSQTARTNQSHSRLEARDNPSNNRSNVSASQSLDKPGSSATTYIRDPSHIPKPSSPSSQEEQLYTLTLLTSQPHHTRMTALRKKYFPPKLNKLPAHLTLFHALPQSHLESDILPALTSLASRTFRFRVNAIKPFRLKRGIAISVPKNQGGAEGEAIRRELQAAWREQGFLSEQDASSNGKLHYTVMNKVDDKAEVQKAFGEISKDWRGDEGEVEGLALWRYDRGWWRWERKFEFLAA